MSDPEPDVREAATNAMNRIIPEGNANGDYKGPEPL